LESLETFLAAAKGCLRHPQDRQRLEAILLRWGTAWQGPRRSLTHALSNHGAFLHFNQIIGQIQCQVFSFHAAPRHGVSMRGPDPDRIRKSHKHRNPRLDSTGLDALFQAWTAHPEARPAGNAIELFLVEAPDEVWEACLQEALDILGRA
jgi:hypothetical protein